MGKNLPMKNLKTNVLLNEDSESFDPMPDIVITTQGVEKLLAGLDPNKASGPPASSKKTPRI